MMNEIDTVLQFWFGELDANGRADAEHSARWWKKDEAFDAQIRTRFGELHAAVARGERDDWLESDRGCLAYVIVLDQFSRNMFRGTGQAFAYDAAALRAALAAIARRVDQRLGPDGRSFLYMPLMHSEDIAVQERCVELFAALRQTAEGTWQEAAASALSYAEQHRDIVKRFGRFPHRNALLGRKSTPEELEFLTQPGSSF
jgi:uncharacterized protein (DUF924 family)